MQPNRPNYSSKSGYQIGLVTNESQRSEALSKMRGKLATSPVNAEVSKPIWTPSLKLKVLAGSGYFTAAVLILGLGFMLNWALRSERSLASTKTASRSVRPLANPTEAMTVDQRALYWAYALYDWQRLVKTFGIPPNAMINNSKAEMELNRLMPQTSAAARIEILGYRNQLRRTL